MAPTKYEGKLGRSFSEQEYAAGCRHVRAGKWKLHVAAGTDGKMKYQMPQLFDMEIDPQESYNVANLHPEIVEKLSRMIETFDAEVKAECPVDP